MDPTAADTLSSIARDWAIALTERRSVTGTDDEKSFGPWLAKVLGERPPFDRAKIWTIEVEPGDGRHCVAMLVPGAGRGTVVLTGHYDTVSTRDYGDLEALATQPAKVTPALASSLVGVETDQGNLARTDLETGQFLAGRGLLDMKAGLAAGLAVCNVFANGGGTAGNLLFLAVPDEENNSAGARKAVQMLPALEREHDLQILAAINLDAIADDGDGSKGRVIALGTVGKLLPTAFVVGIPTHSGFPLNGLNAATIAAAIAARLEWAAELTETSQMLSATPPSLLSIRDGKAAYDVTTPATAFATFNVLSYRRAPHEVLARFDQLCLEAARGCLEALARRPTDGSASRGGRSISLYRYEAVVDRLDIEDRSRLAEVTADLARVDLPLSEQCRLATQEAWRLSRLSGPAIVTGFGSMPYLATSLSDAPGARRLKTIVKRLATESAALYGTTITCTDYFAGISDMSFFGEVAADGLDIVGRNTPLWTQGVRWPKTHALANIPTINIGPWGRDYHTPLERLHIGYAFDVLPRVLSDVCAALLANES
ncbi:M20/M25/M40 family metallo-hydrolase [Mesorhizobium sp. M8A.F.Ca.ET.021.01.1.1]|uniref:M20/M25/M40 family metallo-hydrolase n=3 Tax=Mesorhizobium TaxID=68287 RepID=UPI0016747DBD|nr:M20/M25/M40 family metallo-hydrolase [Mesorhizobium sp. M8A.F.Ca.ET.021.01.1.1]